MPVVITEVGSIRAAVNDIVRFNGSQDATYALIAKGILAGSWHSATSAPHYAEGTLRSVRKEAVCIEQTLRSLPSMLHSEGVEAVSANLLGMGKVEAMLRDTRSYKANLLPMVVLCLAPLKQDYRNDQLIRYGEQVAKHPSMLGVRYHPVIDVDLEHLDNRSTLPEQVKRLYREYKVLEDIAERCFQ